MNERGRGLASSVTEAQGLRIIVEAAPAWSDLFRRHQGWTGADGIYAIPLSGYEGPDNADQTRTLFVFGDTFVGQVGPDGGRRDYVMINNSLALLNGGDPDPDRIRFLWGRGDNGRPQAVFRPDTPKTRERDDLWYWLQDGVCLHGNVFLPAMVLAPNPAGREGFRFKSLGASMIRVPVGADGPDLAAHTQVDSPLYHQNDERRVYFGAAIMPNTASAGAPDPDGYVYVYGRYERMRVRDEVKLAVARVRDTEFEDLKAWHFWDGSDWSADMADIMPLGRGGPELSVTPVTSGPLAGRYLLVSMHVEQDLYIRIGESPRGPFGPRIDIYCTSEPDAGQAIYTYNAKAHPSLSSSGEWLISYNVNSTAWQHHVRNADIYRPRFLKVRFESTMG
jgi:hypothetical protein